MPLLNQMGVILVNLGVCNLILSVRGCTMKLTDTTQICIAHVIVRNSVQRHGFYYHLKLAERQLFFKYKKSEKRSQRTFTLLHKEQSTKNQIEDRAVT